MSHVPPSTFPASPSTGCDQAGQGHKPRAHGADRPAVSSGRGARVGPGTGRRSSPAGTFACRRPVVPHPSIVGTHEGRTDMSAQQNIVVGVDGSACSRAALEFALDEAARRGATLRVIAALPEAGYWAGVYGMSPSLVDELRADIEKVAQDEVDEVLRERGGAAGVPVDVHGVGGAPGRVLVDQARDADLLVVGHRGRGAFRSTVLGSVGLHCVLHATVPVTVVPPRQGSAAAGTGREA